MDNVSSFVHRVLDKVKDKPLTAVAVTNAATAVVVGYMWMRSSGKSLSQVAQLGALAVVRAVPGGNSIIEAKQQEVIDQVEGELLAVTKHEESFPTLPGKGKSREEVETILTRYSDFDAKRWKSGLISGAVYHGGDDLSELITSAYSKFCLSNPLHPDVFPCVRKMEAEVVSMVLDVFNGGPDAVGTVTSGGTESILLAIKAYRDLAKEDRGVKYPELVVPHSAHAAFDKACDYFGVKKVQIPVDPETHVASIESYRKAITSNTIALVGSAVSFPQGVMDPIEDIAALGEEKHIPVHVDCCLGSFVIGFAAAAGFPVKPFDFRLSGVTSISTDTHKYGFAPKGTSVIMYSSAKYRSHQYFVQTDWSGGIYPSPSIAGSRPGGLVAATWAVMMRMGKDGYTQAVKAILTSARKVAEAIRSHPVMKLVGEPQTSVVCFGSRDPKISVYAVADALKAHGWNLNMLQYPECVHLCVTYANHRNANKFIADLDLAVADVKKNPDKYKDGSVAVYGMAASLADRSMVATLARAYIDTCYKIA